VVVLRRDQKSGSYVVEDLGAASTSTSVVRSDTAATAVSGPRPVDASAPAPLAPAANGTAASPEGGDASGPRGVRRRRGRGRRARPGSPLAAGAFMDGTPSTTPDDGSDADDHDDGDDELHAEEGPASSGSSPDTPPAETTHPASAPPEGSPHEPERPAFSFFSWIRREHDPEPHEEPAPAERKPGEES